MSQKTPAAPRLFYDSFEDAARQVVAVLGGAKIVGSLLWPAKSPDAARTRLLDCLNPDRAEVLKPEEIMHLARLGKERGCYAINEHFNAETGFEPPVPISADDEIAALRRAWIESVQDQKVIAARMERLVK